MSDSNQQDTGTGATDPGVQAGATDGAKAPDAGNATSTQTSGAQADGGQKPAGEAKPEEVVYEFKAPEGIELDQARVEKFTALARELKLPADKAQAIVDMGAELIAAQAEAQRAQAEAWAEQVKADKELGGDKLEANLATAAKVYSLLPANEAEAFKGYLNQTGLGNHPSMVRLLVAVGKSLSEDKFVPGAATPPKKSPFYENSNMN